MTKDIQPAALLPCPFCGADVELRKSHMEDGADWIQHIHKSVEPSECGLEEFSEFNIPDITKSWNTRYSDPKLKEREAKLIDAWAALQSLEEWITSSLNKVRFLDHQTPSITADIADEWFQSGLGASYQTEIKEIKATLATIRSEEK